MCGIFAIVSKPIDAFRLEPDLRRLPGAEESLDELKRSLATLDFERTHLTYTERAARDHWRALLAHLGNGGAESAEEIRREVAWRVEHDLLDLVDAMSALLDDPERRERGAPVWIAWQAELTLRALGRLEVRGRDSAGLAVMLWYDDEASRDRVFAGEQAEDQVFRYAVPGTACLVLNYKVAEEVGALGYNESTLRGLLRADRYFRQAIRAAPRQAVVMAHTRWASNGIISIANAHPVDGALEAGKDGGWVYPPGRTLAVLNGDVDNFLELLPSLAGHGKVPAGVTTDAKVIPSMVEAERNAGPRRPGDGLDRAVVETFERIEGSVAIVVTRADRPGMLWCGLKGTGQALYLADAGDALVVASEVYGSAELTDRYWPLEKAQERLAGGRDAVVVRLEVRGDGTPCVHRLSGAEPACLKPDYRQAEITTRDVDRRSFEHFFRKELEEAVLSVRKTIDGRYERHSPPAIDPRHAEEPEIDFTGLYSAPHAGLFDAIRAQELRRFVFVGQGSAHVAGRVGSRLLAAIVGDVGLTAQAMTAGDFSAHELRSDLSHTCLVAISQSGTTTDTNRCLALARERGARVIGIVNRRNSAMVDLCDAVIYTSDGRDVEMAVASTKAFYSQVVAAFMLAQHLGLLTGAVVPTQVAAALAELERLPAVMEAVFAREPQVAEQARAVGLRRRHWSVLGSGASLATSEEVRIKFSELCYKSVSVDLLENKKHIDLSAEPLILAVLHDLRADLVSDAVKEVSIFAAHRAVTVVICDRDGDLYRGHTPHVLEVPPIGYGLGAVTTAIVGHLFAYHTAVAMDEVAQRLRRLRKALLATERTGGAGFELAAEARELRAELLRGDLDALWPAGSAGRLATTLQILAAEPGIVAELSAWIPDPGVETAAEVEAWCRNQLSQAIADSTRSIDSIRHQAKTITVGTSRSGYSRTSVMGRALTELGVGMEDLPLALLSALTAVDDMLSAIPSGIRYEVLPPSPQGTLGLRVRKKIGLARDARSRFDEGAPLTGTKATVVRRRQAMVIEGIRDGSRLLVFPVLRRGQPVEVVLLHLVLAESPGEARKLRFLEAFPQRAEQLTEHFGEILGRPVELRELARLEAEDLLFTSPAAIDKAALAYQPA